MKWTICSLTKIIGILNVPTFLFLLKKEYFWSRFGNSAVSDILLSSSCYQKSTFNFQTPHCQLIHLHRMYTTDHYIWSIEVCWNFPEDFVMKHLIIKNINSQIKSKSTRSENVFPSTLKYYLTSLLDSSIKLYYFDKTHHLIT